MFKPEDFGITLRSAKGEPLTHEEMDRNFKVTGDFIKYSFSSNDYEIDEFIALMNPVGVFKGGEIPAQDKEYIAYLIDESMLGKIYACNFEAGRIIVYDGDFDEVDTILRTDTSFEFPENAKYLVCDRLTQGATFTEGLQDSGSGSGSSSGSGSGSGNV